MLIVVQEEAAGGWGKVGKASTDGALALGAEVCVGDMNLAAVEQARGTQRDFPAADARMIHRHGEEDVRVAEHIVVEEVLHAGAEVVAIEGPTMEGDGDAELALLVALAVQRKEVEALIQCE